MERAKQPPCLYSPIYGLRSGVITVNLLNQATKAWDPKEDDRVVTCGLETISVLQRWDELKLESGNQYMVPQITT